MSLAERLLEVAQRLEIARLRSEDRPGSLQCVAPFLDANAGRVGELRVLRSRPRDGDAQRLHRPLVVACDPVLNDAAQAASGAEPRHQVPGELTEIG